MHRIRRWPRAGLAVAALACALAVLAGCASDSAGPKPTNPALADGYQVYADHCATCHGSQGGGGAGPKLAGTVAHTFPNIADQIAVIENGKSGGMPAWKGTLTSSQIEDVARYERQCLGQKSC